MPSAASADLLRGPKRLDQVDFYFRNPRFEERDKTNGGLKAAFFIADLELNDGAQEETAWEIAPVDWLNDRDTGEPKAQVTDDGTFVDVDEENPYQISGSSEAGMLFHSLEENGISSSVMQRLCSEPALLDGVKVHGIQQTTGRTYVAKKGARKGQTIEVTVLVVESVIEDPNTDNKNKKAAKPGTAGRAAAKPGPAAAPAAGGRAGRKAAPVIEPEEPADIDTIDEVSESDQAGIDTVLTVLEDPKKHVKTYSARQNGGGVTMAQMATAAMTAYKGKQPPKSEVVALVRDPDWSESYADAGGWTFDRAKGIYSLPAAD